MDRQDVESGDAFMLELLSKAEAGWDVVSSNHETESRHDDAEKL